MRKVYPKEDWTLIRFSGLFSLVQNVFSLRQSSSMKWNFRGGLWLAVSGLTLEIYSGIDIWSPKSEDTFLLLAAHFLASLCLGSIPHQRQIVLTEFYSSVLVHERHWELYRVEVDTWPSQSMTYETYCKSKALYWFFRMDWKLTFISQKPLTCSLSVYSQQSTFITQLCSKIINFYFRLFPFTIHCDFAICMESGQIDVFI